MTSCVVSVTGDLLHDVLRVEAEEGSRTPLVIPDPLLKLGKVRASRCYLEPYWTMVYQTKCKWDANTPLA